MPANEARTARARVDHFRSERERLNQEITRTGAQLSARTAQLDQARSRLESAGKACEALELKLRDARGIAGQRGERLRLIDLGVVPSGRRHRTCRSTSARAAGGNVTRCCIQLPVRA
jgi:hypothetical protein